MNFKIEVIYGRVEIDTRMRPNGQFQGRKRVYDEGGNLKECTEWENTVKLCYV